MLAPGTIATHMPMNPGDMHRLTKVDRDALLLWMTTAGANPDYVVAMRYEAGTLYTEEMVQPLRVTDVGDRIATVERTYRADAPPVWR